MDPQQTHHRSDFERDIRAKAAVGEIAGLLLHDVSALQSRVQSIADRQSLELERAASALTQRDPKLAASIHSRNLQLRSEIAQIEDEFHAVINPLRWLLESGGAPQVDLVELRSCVQRETAGSIGGTVDAGPACPIRGDRVAIGRAVRLVAETLTQPGLRSKVNVSILQDETSGTVRFTAIGPRFVPSNDPARILAPYYWATVFDSAWIRFGTNLWVANAITRAHGGRILVESELLLHDSARSHAKQFRTTLNLRFARAAVQRYSSDCSDS